VFLSTSGGVRLTLWRRVSGLCTLPLWGRTSVLPFCFAVALVSLAPALSDQQPVPEFGIVAFDLRDPVPSRLKTLGVGVVRGSCDWPMLEPAQGRFDWTCSDDVIVGAERLGMRSYMTVGCTPAWANRGNGCGTMPSDISDWYEFVRAFLGRYTRYHTILGVWNEPNLTLRDSVDATNYALLFVNASLARESVDPQSALAGPETSHHALASGYYLHAVDAIQAARAFAPQDVVAVHWYPDGPPLTGYIDAVTASGVAGTSEVWLSEVGMASTNADAEAAFYRSTLLTFAANRNPRWTNVIFYRLWDGQPCCSEAILNPDYTPKPAFFELRRAITKIRRDARERVGREP
jgi:hypothetical protein